MRGLVRCVYVGRRFCSTNVRVRFAPSPTGQLHLGGLRTALYNYLFARSHGGKFVLRIEDTDQKRLVPGAMEKLIDILQWSGIEIDEGPSVGGDFGPYIQVLWFQSERKDIYTSHVNTLIERGAAYPCFCTPTRLELLRKACARRGEVYRYDNRCRHLTPAEREEKMHTSPSYNVRFKLHSYDKPWQDMVYGPIVTDIAKIEGDPIIMKSDGFPTYHLANVVDDHLMNISHVLRGVEWQVSTTKHILLYDAFGWKPPQYAHLPLLMKDNKKLSKRNNNSHVDYFRAEGYLAESVLSFLTAQGSGFRGTDTANMIVDEMIQEFDINTLKTTSTNLDYRLIERLNREHLRRKMEDESSKSHLISELRDMVCEKFHLSTSDDRLSDARLEFFIHWALDRIVRLSDLVGPKFAFFWTIPSEAVLLEHVAGGQAGSTIDSAMDSAMHTALAIVRDLHGEIQALAHYAHPDLVALFKAYTREGVTYKEVMKLMRVILCGLKEGPSVADMCIVLGRESVEQRLKAAIHLYTHHSTQKQRLN